MIITKLIGGMGNQMFQYALGRYLSIKNNTELKIDKYDLEHAKVDTPRDYNLNVFSIEEKFATPEEVAVLKKKWKSTWYKMKRKFFIGENFYTQTYIQEKTLAFDAEVLKVKEGYLDGFWQSEKYFADIEGTIRADFTVKLPPSADNSRVLEAIQNTNSVSLHVRRGDYVANDAASQRHNITSLAYYQKCIEHIKTHVKDPQFFIFSDDPDWAKDNIETGTSKFVSYNDARTQNHEDLRLMYNCKHNVIANSSFSWWGAWLNPNPNKIVCAPARWLNEPEEVYKDIVPTGWIKFSS